MTVPAAATPGHRSVPKRKLKHCDQKTTKQTSSNQDSKSVYNYHPQHSDEEKKAITI